MLNKTPSEAELLQACIKGDTSAFEAIVEKYQSLVCAITYGATADLERSEELAHEVFIKVWTNLSQLRDLSKFRAWLYAIVQNIIRNYFRGKKRDILSRAGALEEKQGIASERFKVTETIVDKEQQAVIRRALEQIPEKYRTPLVLFYRQGQSIKEVAEVLGLSEEAVKTQISRGRKMLRREVAAMVESTISRTGPGRAFTTAVMASVAGLVIKGSATAAGAAATVIGGGKAAVLSGAAAKIITAAAVVIISVGAVVAYKQLNKPKEVPDLPQAEFATRKQEKQDSDMEKAFVKAVTEIEEDERLEADASEEIDSIPDNEPSSIGDYANEQEPKPGVEGFVIDKASSRPIQGAQVFYERGNTQATYITDESGHFEFFDMQPQEQQWIFIIAENYTSRKITLDIIKDKVYENFKIELTPGSKVAGAVYDQRGEPVKGATVRVYELYSRVVTDANGFFEIDGLDPAWGRYNLAVRHPNYSGFGTRFVPANAGETVWQDIVLKPGVTIYGQVTDAEGNPISGADVGTTGSLNQWHSVRTGTDSQGRYKLKNIDVQYGLVLWSIDNTHAPYVEDVNFDSLPDKILKNIQLADSVPLHGKIIDKQGNPVTGVSVSISGYKGISRLSADSPKLWVTSDSEGRFTLRNAPPQGKVTLEVYADFIACIEPEVEAGQKEEHIIEVERSGVIYGRVVEDETSEPIGRFNVKISPSTKGSKPFRGGYDTTWGDEGHNFDSTDGYFDTARASIPVGDEYSVTVYADGFDPLTIDPVIVQPISEDSHLTEFRLKPATAIAGRVVDSNGVAIAGARIRVLSNNAGFEHWDDRDTTVTNSEGEFYLSGLGQQEKLVYITAATYGPYMGSSTDLPRDSDGTIQIALQRGADISGRVFYSNGKAAADASISVGILQEEIRMKFPILWQSLEYAVTDANGYYEMYDLPAGSFSISANSSLAEGNLHIAYKKITLKAGEYAEINFGDEAGFAITGIVRAGAKPLEKAEVYISSSGEYLRWSYTDDNGKFIIAGIPEGTYYIHTVYRTGFDPKTLQWGPGEIFFDGRQVTVEGDVKLDVDLGDVSSNKANP